MMFSPPFASIENCSFQRKWVLENGEKTCQRQICPIYATAIIADECKTGKFEMKIKEEG